MPVITYIFIALAIVALFPALIATGFAGETRMGRKEGIITSLIIFSPQILTFLSVLLILTGSTSQFIIFLPLFCIPLVLSYIKFGEIYKNILDARYANAYQTRLASLVSLLPEDVRSAPIEYHHVRTLEDEPDKKIYLFAIPEPYEKITDPWNTVSQGTSSREGVQFVLLMINGASHRIEKTPFLKEYSIQCHSFINPDYFGRENTDINPILSEQENKITNDAHTITIFTYKNDSFLQYTFSLKKDGPTQWKLILVKDGFETAPYKGTCPNKTYAMSDIVSALDSVATMDKP